MLTLFLNFEYWFRFSIGQVYFLKSVNVRYTKIFQFIFDLWRWCASNMSFFCLWCASIQNNRYMLLFQRVEILDQFNVATWFLQTIWNIPKCCWLFINVFLIFRTIIVYVAFSYAKFNLLVDRFITCIVSKLWNCFHSEISFWIIIYFYTLLSLHQIINLKLNLIISVIKFYLRQIVNFNDLSWFWGAVLFEK